MTQYIVDGDVGSIESTLQDSDYTHHSTVDSVNIVDGTNYISLNAPTSLEFFDITWKVKFRTIFADRALREPDLSHWQPDEIIDGEIGYVLGSPWYSRTEGIREGFEAHGGVDGAWWQVIMIGYGRALFTNGIEMVTIDLLEDSWYTVQMALGTFGGFATVTINDAYGETVALLRAVGLSITYAQSYLGASGTVFNYGGDTTPAEGITVSEVKTFTEVRSWVDAWIQLGPGQYPGTIGFSERVLAQHTDEIGTSSGITDWPWYDHPEEFASLCTGLQFTFANWATSTTWVKFYVPSVPEGYENGSLRVRTYVGPNDGNWAANTVQMRANSWAYGWPTTIQDGPVVGSLRLTTAMSYGNYYPMDALIPVGTVVGGQYAYYGFTVAAVAGEAVASCSAGDWPFQNGAYNSWTARLYGTDGGPEFEWVKPILNGGTLALDCDEIILDGGSDIITGEPIVEEAQPMEGWNTEMREVVGGTVTIGATPVNGSVNVYSVEGELLDYGSEWEEADDLGLIYNIYGDHEAVTVVYFVTRPVLGTHDPLSRPSQIRSDENRKRGPYTSFP